MAIKIVFLLATLLAASPVRASIFLDNQSPEFNSDTVYNDDVFITGFRIKFDSKVTGDLFTFGYEVVQTDSIMAGLNIFANEAQNLGPVLGTYRAFARTVSCNAPVGRNVLAMGQDINIGPQADIGMNTDLFGANVVFQGRSGNNVKIHAHNAVISGFIGGNLNFSGDSLAINPNTVIKGNLIYSAPRRASIGMGAIIEGQTDWKKIDPIERPDKKGGNSFWNAITWVISLRGYLILASFMNLVVLTLSLIPFPHWLAFIFLWVTLVISGNILILISKDRAWAADKILNDRFFPSMGLGFIILFLAPMIALVLFFTALAAPLAVLLMMLFGVATFVGLIYISLNLGKRVCQIFSSGASQTPGYLCYTIGITLLMFVSLVPILGYLVVLIAIMTGLGGLWQSFFGSKAGQGSNPTAMA